MSKFIHLTKCLCKHAFCTRYSSSLGVAVDETDSNTGIPRAPTAVEKPEQGGGVPDAWALISQGIKVESFTNGRMLTFHVAPEALFQTTREWLLKMGPEHISRLTKGLQESSQIYNFCCQLFPKSLPKMIFLPHSICSSLQWECVFCYLGWSWIKFT